MGSEYDGTSGQQQQQQQQQDGYGENDITGVFAVKGLLQDDACALDFQQNSWSSYGGMLPPPHHQHQVSPLCGGGSGDLQSPSVNCLQQTSSPPLAVQSLFNSPFPCPPDTSSRQHPASAAAGFLHHYRSPPHQPALPAQQQQQQAEALRNSCLFSPDAWSSMQRPLPPHQLPPHHQQLQQQHYQQKTSPAFDDFYKHQQQGDRQSHVPPAAASIKASPANSAPTKADHNTSSSSATSSHSASTGNSESKSNSTKGSSILIFRMKIIGDF
jgi:hypothetical protein